MKAVFVKTSNWERFTDGIQAVDNRGAAEACMLLVNGEPGLGKTSIITRWALENNAIFVTAQSGWTVSEMLRAMANSKPGIPAHHTLRDTRASVIGHVMRNQVPIVVDEADHVVACSATIEALRGISDMCQTPVVMVGMERIQQKLARYPQVASRIATVVKFEPVTETDVMLTCRDMAEVEIGRCLVSELHRQCAGRMRLVLNGIARIEQFAKVNGLKSISLQDMRGAELAHDWQSARRGAK
ncbi:AAA family ATPase [Jeongeupia chitinilytica]|uniref:DNA segregation ATPase n=1 Tax=Jeongeupia chitinilytica TaxID=1041641 RepID=A0ABQ3H071_9NEIS|nr:ATP-binding protein [Jeongeupia chitinilytica]GHD63746.1 DNA segregation ATPase [Jeongeupia chitinilytica]